MVRPLRCVLPGIAVCVTVALFLAPATRWLVRQQALISIGRYHLLPGRTHSYTTSSIEDRHRMNAAAASAPEDFGLHYAALDGPGYVGAAAGMRGLVSRFPNQPALYANILRYDTPGVVRIDRPEGRWLEGTKPSPNDYHPKPSMPAALAAYDQTAAEGERIDPNNAYFSLMRAVGLLAAHRDAEAEAAVRRAGTKTAWREYIADDIQSRWRLKQAAFGDRGVIPQAFIAYNTLLPQYQQMRQAVSVLAYRAMQKEQAGNIAGGLALRESLRRCGDLMRVQSNFLIGSIIGSSLCDIACLRPGGTPPPPELPSHATEELQTTRYRATAQAFAKYARQHGQPGLAAKALAEAEAGVRVSAVQSSVSSRENSILEPINRLVNWWTADVAILANIFWLLALWAVAVVASTGRRFAPALSGWLPSLGQIIGVLLGATVLLAFCFLLLVLAINMPSVGGKWLTGAIILLFLAALALAMRGAARRIPWPRLRQASGWRTLGLLGLTLSTLTALYTLLLWQTHGLWATGAAKLCFLPDASPFDFQDDGRRSLFEGIAIATALIAPLLLTLGAALAARLRPAPRLARFGASLRVLAPATACVLLVVYGGLVLGTLRQEAGGRGQLEATVHSSGPYFAARAGLPWPGAVR